MSIAIRCTGCRKKISVDDGFAGGAARCPYCKEIVLVAGAAGGRSAPRPESPDQPAGPQPAPPADAAMMAEVISAQEVPMARPVRIQGIFTIVLLLAVLAMVGAGILLGVHLAARKSATDAANSEQAAREANVALGGVTQGASNTGKGAAGGAGPAGAADSGRPFDMAPGTLASPVLYCVPSGGSMKHMFDYARAMVRLSVRNLTPQQKFDLVLLMEDKQQSLPDGWRSPGPEADAAVKTLLEAVPSGEVDIAKAVEALLARQPKSIVLYSRQAVANPDELAAKVKAAGAVLYTVCIQGDAAARESLAKLATATGGRSMAYNEAEMQAAVDAAPALD